MEPGPAACENQVTYLSKKYYIPLHQFTVIYNGVDLNRWTLMPVGFEQRQMRANYGIPVNADVIVQVARFRKEKSHEDSLRALAMLHKMSSRRPYLLFVGSGDASIEKRLRKLTLVYALQDFVVFCGHQSDVRSFYWISNMFTLSSRSETFSLAALEAMACGLPCVLTDLGGAREMVIDGVNGYVVPPAKPTLLAQAWGRVLDERNHYSPTQIREHIAKHFALDDCVKSYQDLLLA